MVWHSIGVYIINRTLHDRLEIRNFSSRVEKYFTRSLRSLVKYFSTLKEKFRISARPCNILYLSTIQVIAHLFNNLQNTFVRFVIFQGQAQVHAQAQAQGQQQQFQRLKVYRKTKVIRVRQVPACLQAVNDLALLLPASFNTASLNLVVERQTKLILG